MMKNFLLSLLTGVLAFSGVSILFWGTPAQIADLLIKRSHIESLVDPNDPGLEPLKKDFQQMYGLLGESARTPDQIALVAKTITQKHIPYKSDLELYGVIDKWSSTKEILAKGADDCDGQTIIAVALLRSQGFDAQIHRTFTHVWEYVPGEENFGNREEHEQEVIAVAKTDGGWDMDMNQAVETTIKQAPRSLSNSAEMVPDLPKIPVSRAAMSLGMFVLLGALLYQVKKTGEK